MKQVFRQRGNAARRAHAVGVETSRGPGKGAASFAVSGIATVVALGVPFGRIAQAAPAASYMVVDGSAGEGGAHASFVASSSAGPFTLDGAAASAAGNFWRFTAPAATGGAAVGKHQPAAEPGPSRPIVEPVPAVDARYSMPHYASADSALARPFYRAESSGADVEPPVHRFVFAPLDGHDGHAPAFGTPYRFELAPGSAADVDADRSTRAPNFVAAWPPTSARQQVEMAVRPTPPLRAAGSREQEGHAARAETAAAADPDPDRASAPNETRADTAPVTAPAKGAKIERIDITGNSVFGTAELLDSLQLAPTNWASWYTGGDLYSAQQLTDGQEAIRRRYLDRGYLQFRFESLQTSVTPDGRRVSVRIAIHEGERYTVSRVAIEGAPPALSSALDALVTLRSGDALALDQLQASTRAIGDRLSRDGYAYANVSPLSKVDPAAHTVELTLKIEPGPRVSVRDVVVSGNTVTRDHVIRRALGDVEHEPYDPNRLDAARVRLERLGYLSKVDVKAVPVAGSSDQVDLRANVVERPGAIVTVGAGYNTTDRAIGTGSFRHDNIFGTGQSLAAQFSLAKSTQAIDIAQTDPYFTRGGVSRRASVYAFAREPLYYTSDSRFRINTLGVGLGFGIPVAEDSRIEIGAAFEAERLDPDRLTPQPYRDYVNSYGRDARNVPVRLGWSIDRRDRRDRSDLPAPGRGGYQARFGVEYGTPAGSNQYYKADAWATYAYPFARQLVLAATLSGGVGRAPGHRPYPLSKNYFAGGIGSVRGYQAGSLGPRDVGSGQPIGGSKMFAGSVETSFPLPVFARREGVSALAFVDGGNVWGAQGASVGANGMRFSYGAGVAWQSKYGSVKASVGLPIARREHDQLQNVQVQFAAVF